MSQKLREALEYARNCLWWLIVESEKGNLELSADQKAAIDQAEQLAEDALREGEAEE